MHQTSPRMRTRPVPGSSSSNTPTTSTSHRRREISILLWNTWLLPGPLTDNNTHARASEIPIHLLGHDIILLNEAFTHKSLIIDALRSTHPYVATLPRRCWLWPIFDSGLVVLSRYAILEVRRTRFGKRRRWDLFAGKGSIGVRIDLSRRYKPEPSQQQQQQQRQQQQQQQRQSVARRPMLNPNGDPYSDTESSDYDDDEEEEEETFPPKTIDIYNTHMQAGNTRGEHSARHAQSLQLGQFIAQNSFRASSVVLGGDLNMGPILESVHYADDEDAKERVKAYGVLKEASGLEDVKVLVEGKGGDINRFLTRGVGVVSVEYPGVPVVRGLKGKGKRLSDSDMVVLKVSV